MPVAFFFPLLLPRPASPLRALLLFPSSRSSIWTLLAAERGQVCVLGCIISAPCSRTPVLPNLYSLVLRFYKYTTETTDEYLYRFRIILDKKKERRVLFKFEAFQYTETGSLFIENFKKYKWQTFKPVFKQFLQICVAKIEFVMKINRIMLEVDTRRVDATQFMLLENELAELGYSKEKELLETDRMKVEPGTWVVYVWKSDEREQRIVALDKKINSDKEWHSSFGVCVAKDDEDRN